MPQKRGSKFALMPRKKRVACVAIKNSDAEALFDNNQQGKKLENWWRYSQLAINRVGDWAELYRNRAVLLEAFISTAGFLLKQKPIKSQLEEFNKSRGIEYDSDLLDQAIYRLRCMMNHCRCFKLSGAAVPRRYQQFEAVLRLVRVGSPPKAIREPEQEEEKEGEEEEEEEQACEGGGDGSDDDQALVIVAMPREPVDVVDVSDDEPMTLDKLCAEFFVVTPTKPSKRLRLDDTPTPQKTCPANLTLADSTIDALVARNGGTCIAAPTAIEYLRQFAEKKKKKTKKSKSMKRKKGKKTTASTSTTRKRYRLRTKTAPYATQLKRIYSIAYHGKTNEYKGKTGAAQAIKAMSSEAQREQLARWAAGFRYIAGIRIVGKSGLLDGESLCGVRAVSNVFAHTWPMWRYGGQSSVSPGRQRKGWKPPPPPGGVPKPIQKRLQMAQAATRKFQLAAEKAVATKVRLEDQIEAAETKLSSAAAELKEAKRAEMELVKEYADSKLPSLKVAGKRRGAK